MILIIGETDDNQVGLVTRELDERRATYFIFDPRHYPAVVKLTVEFSPAGVMRRDLVQMNKRLDLAEVRAVWHPARGRPEPHRHVRSDQVWWVTETSLRFLCQVYECLDCFWVPEKPVPEREPFLTDQLIGPRSHAGAHRANCLQVPSPENKLHQLSVAGRAGFAVPRTLVTNDPERFLDFYDACNGELISKRAADIRPRVAGEPTRPFTMTVARRDTAGSSAVRYAPVTFQENVPKRVELRITVVGKKVFAAEIRSQESARQSVDWRHAPDYGQSKYYSRHQLPAIVESRCVQVVERLGMCFGTMDLIQRPDGEYVFLEVNMNGQWAYIEEMLDLPISSAIAELLTQADTSKLPAIDGTATLTGAGY
jgi:hypothetical protein